jgi:hypothetical protein
VTRIAVTSESPMDRTCPLNLSNLKEAQTIYSACTDNERRGDEDADEAELLKSHGSNDGNDEVVPEDSAQARLRLSRIDESVPMSGSHHGLQTRSRTLRKPAAC